VQVPCDEGVANHIGPKPCAGIREAAGEASVGVRAGQPLSRERKLVLGADAVCWVEGYMGGRVSASARPNPAWSETLACPHIPCTGTGRSPAWPRVAVCARGPHREGEEPKPMMYELEKSDSLVVPRKLANKAGVPAAEPMEGSGGIARNTNRQPTARTQRRSSRVSCADSRTRAVVARLRVNYLR
jgi:hypothetical protein